MVIFLSFLLYNNVHFYACSTVCVELDVASLAVNAIIEVKSNF